MGLLSVIRKTKRKQKEVRVLILGLDNAGKSTILAYYMHEDTTHVSPTFGFTIKHLHHAGLNLNVWDIGGQRSLRPFWRNYFEKSECLIWVVDMQMPERFKECYTALIDVLQEDRLLGSILLILLNKVDTVPEERRQQLIKQAESLFSPQNIQALAVSDYMILPVSACTGENLDTALDWLTQTVKQRLFALEDAGIKFDQTQSTTIT
ncbi:hypothetical protein CANCADRAFT_26286 [Tortispora caseinolytica NRRL Y-17796]|uniref:ADP-ribosylation factor-like protein 2 n=1 Tax=Tortispora caseinolytica NRRL Y-17796 TaxID=767744 RepID=A0A1E4TFT6_9ASCO|nr:hypothetical protein CANCADRAFT_26286 [Tortispora caseinolytica NRRL Y-17796]